MRDIAGAVFRWYGLEAIAVLCLCVALVGSGPDRILFAFAAMLSATTAVRLRRGDHSGWGFVTRVLQTVLGASAILGGAAMVGLGGILGWAGSYGILAAMVLIPAGLGIVTMGMGLARVGWSPSTAVYTDGGLETRGPGDLYEPFPRRSDPRARRSERGEPVH